MSHHFVWLLVSIYLVEKVGCLHIVTPSGTTENRPLTLYQAPRPYRDGRPLNSVIITSKPINMAKNVEENATTTSSTTDTTPKILETSSIPGPESSLQLDCAPGKSCSTTIEISTVKPTYKQYPSHLLEQLLKEYASVRTSKPPTAELNDMITNSSPNNNQEASTTRLASLILDDRNDNNNNNNNEFDVEMDPVESKEERWSLISRPHKHPYDDHNGWVTLDPVPWSSTKISKWQSAVAPSYHQQRPSIETERPWHHYPPTHHSKPPIPTNWYDKIETAPYDRPISSSYEPSYRPPWTDKPPSRPNWPDKNSEIDYPYEMKPIPKPRPDCNNNNNEIDYQDKPYNRFPFQPPIQHPHPPTYPMMGDGQWVLLSSTKGYSLPQARSLEFSPGAVVTKSTRGIKLTVLPSMKGEKNMTTSHGGLLEVESSFQTIDEAQQQIKNKSQQQQQQQQQIAQMSHSTALSNKMEADRRTAMLAAVGAGILPATMAMVVPLMLGKRKKRELLNYPIDFQSRQYQNDDQSAENITPRKRIHWKDGCRVKYHHQQQQQQPFEYHYQRDSTPSINQFLKNIEK